MSDESVNSEERVQWVYASENNQQIEERYDQWANEYDEDLADDFGYVMPRMAAEIFERFVAKDARVLDAGAGTGLVGVELNRLGYGNLEAMDISRGMLEVAGAKNVYDALHQKVMGEPLGFRDRYLRCGDWCWRTHAGARSGEFAGRVGAGDEARRRDSVYAAP